MLFRSGVLSLEAAIWGRPFDGRGEGRAAAAVGLRWEEALEKSGRRGGGEADGRVGRPAGSRASAPPGASSILIPWSLAVDNSNMLGFAREPAQMHHRTPN